MRAVRQALVCDKEFLYFAIVQLATGMVMDWREMAGYPTAGRPPFYGADIWSGGRKIENHESLDRPFGLGGTDPIRGWIIAFCWLLASGAE